MLDNLSTTEEQIAGVEFLFDEKNIENSMEGSAMQRGIVKKMGAE